MPNSDKAPFTTAAEQTTAKGMDDLAGEIGARFALALGDNFYYDGVTSVDDHRFKDTFENVFTGSNLQGEDFFRVLAGNHDHNGNVTAQIAYTDGESANVVSALYNTTRYHSFILRASALYTRTSRYHSFILTHRFTPQSLRALALPLAILRLLRDLRRFQAARDHAGYCDY